MMPPQCFDCKHLFLGKDNPGMKCSAFPDGIPIEIRKNRHDHRQPYQGDHGIRFEPSESAIRLGLISPEPPYDHRTLPRPVEDLRPTPNASKPRKLRKRQGPIAR